MIVAALQYTSKDDLAATCAHAKDLIAKAAGKGATFVCLPECANFLARNKDSLYQQAEVEETSLFLSMAKASAQQHQIWLSLGSLMMQSTIDDDNRIHNRHYIINPAGQIISYYDKIHMFDANVNDGQTYRESRHFISGDTPVMTEIDGHKTGLSICYDVRFAGLYHHYAKAQAEMLLIPAAFTATTGAAHWHVLQRSRAIETGAFVIAAAQTGTHDDGRQTYGHALIVNPWGEVLDDAGPDGDMALADLDFNDVTKARARLSAWAAQRHF